MSLPKESTLRSLPPPWPHPLLPQIRAMLQTGAQTLIVLDDDPTGTQTVYDLPVLTDWSLDTLTKELVGSSPVFFILTNSRSLTPSAAAELNREIGRNVRAAAHATGRTVAVVSRSDSTLRGHFPAETDALAAALGERIDGLLIIPYFLEGGRLTIDDIHYVAEGETLIPAAATPFARDPSFGYRASNLRAWVEEKSNGRVQAADVASITLDDLRRGGPDRVAARLALLEHGRVCVVNATCARDMEVFVLGLLQAERTGKHFLYRTAASFVQTRAGLAPRALLDEADLALPAVGGGLIVVGSFVPKSSEQLTRLLQQDDLAAVELHVNRLLDATTRLGEIEQARKAVTAHLRSHRDVVLFTSRGLVTGAEMADNLAIGRQISSGLVAVVQTLDVRPRYLLAKGGITSSDLATAGLGIRRAWVMGQLLPGVPVWRAGEESLFPGLTYIVFPGNVGDPDALVTAALRLRSTNAEQTNPEPQFVPLAALPHYTPDEMQQRAQDFYTEIRRRRSVRDFSDRPIDRAVIEACVAAAGTAPNGANLQPWHFVVIGDPAVKQRIQAAAEAEEQEFYNSRAPKEWLDALAPLGTDAKKPFLKRAPYLIAIFAQPYSLLADGRKVKNYYVNESVGIATGFLIAALHHAGLATLTHTPSPMAFLNEILARPPHERPFLLLVVGFPADDAKVPQISKKPLDQICTFV